MSDSVAWIIRPNTCEDANAIVGLWRDHIRSMYPFRSMSHGEFALVGRRIETMASTKDILVASLEDDHDIILGFSCSWVSDDDLQVLYFVYVRDAYRQAGIATKLLRRAFPHFGSSPVMCVFPGRSTKHLRDKWRLKQNPFLL